MPKNKPVIREATSKDVNNLCQLWLELIKHHDGWGPTFSLQQIDLDKIKAIIENRMGRTYFNILICEEEDELIGMIIASFSEGSDVFELYKKGYIAETVIKENQRGKGIGKKLLEAAEEWLKQKGADHIELQVAIKNEVAQKFWSKAGYFPTTHHMVKKCN